MVALPSRMHKAEGADSWCGLWGHRLGCPCSEERGRVYTAHCQSPAPNAVPGSWWSLTDFLLNKWMSGLLLPPSSTPSLMLTYVLETITSYITEVVTH